MSTVTNGSSLAISLISRSIEGSVEISSASNTEPGPTPKLSKLADFAVTTISSILFELKVKETPASLPNLVKILVFVLDRPDLVTVILNGPPNLSPLE